MAGDVARRSPGGDRPASRDENPERRLAERFVEHTDRHVFLTGRAGTGKTTFLHDIRDRTPKRTVVTAPTGVAAINARGVTLHSFFQLPLGPNVPGRRVADRGRPHRISRAKRRIIENLDLLIVDEVSMVRADVLDGVDEVLRRLRRDERPFGGVQLLMIGDLGQLAPIAGPDEDEILRRVYDSLFFFGSWALAEAEWISVELRKVYRQTDRGFLELLDRVREGRIDRSVLRQLGERVDPEFEPPEDEGWITLSTHNRKVDAINASRLDRLPGEIRRFEAGISGRFSKSGAPAPELLELKHGAQVMFVRNDPSPEQRYFNGRIGEVAGFSEAGVRVRCPGDRKEIIVGPATWENVTYRLDEETGEIREEVLGEFVQVPLKLAWAITIHKSQGLTFDRAVIDAGSAFAPGQVYVALSRCRTLDGIVLTSTIPPEAIRTDDSVRRFRESRVADPPGEEDLAAARRDAQRRLLRDVYGLEELRRRCRSLFTLLRDHASVLQVGGVGEPDGLISGAREEILDVAPKFVGELERHFGRDVLPEDDPVLRERLVRASDWFREKIDEHLSPLAQLRIETDNRELAGRLEIALERLGEETAVVRRVLEVCGRGFSPRAVFRARREASRGFAEEAARRRRSAEGTETGGAPMDVHDELFERLLRWRAAEAESVGGMPHHRILRQKILAVIARELPASRKELRSIKGVGKATMKKYGGELLEIVEEYRRELAVREEDGPGFGAAPETEEPEEAETSGPVAEASRRQTLGMFERGMTVGKIAARRQLSISTIHGHLAAFVRSGDLPVDAVLPSDRRRAVEKLLDQRPDDTLGEVRAAADGDVTLGELQLVAAHRARPGAEGDGM